VARESISLTLQNTKRRQTRRSRTHERLVADVISVPTDSWWW